MISGFVFGLFIVLFVLLSVAFLCFITFSKKVEINRKHLPSVAERLIVSNDANSGIDFERITISSVEHLRTNVEIVGLKVRRDFLKVKAPAVGFVVSPLSILNAKVIRAIEPLQNISINIDLDKYFNRIKKKNNDDEQVKSRTIENSLHRASAMVDNFSKFLTTLINERRHVLYNGIQIGNSKIVFSSRDIKNTIEINESKTSLLNGRVVRNNDRLFAELATFVRDGDNQNRFFSKVGKNIDVLNELNDNEILKSDSSLKLNNADAKLSIICAVGSSQNIDCAIKVVNLQLSSLEDIITKKMADIGFRNLALDLDKVDAKLFISIRNGKVDSIKCESSIKVLGGTRLGNFSSTISSIKVMLKTSNVNKKTPKKSVVVSMSLQSEDKDFVVFNVSDLFFRGDKPSFKIMAYFNDVDLSELLKLKDNNAGANLPFSGRVNGSFFAEIKDGVLSTSLREVSNLTLKKFSYSSGDVFLDLSNYNLDLKIDDTKIICSYKDDSKNGSLEFVYDLEKNIADVRFNSVEINKDVFNNFKKLFASQESFLLYNFEYNSFITGEVEIPFDKDKKPLLNKCNVDIKADLYEKDLFDADNNHVLISLNKKANEEQGKIVIDFASSYMRSALYKFLKKRQDSSIIDIDFVLKDLRNIQLNGKWEFNKKKVCSFSYTKNGNAFSAKVSADNFNVDVNIGNEKDYVGVYGDNIVIDRVFAKTLVFLITRLTKYIPTDKLTFVDINTKNVWINKDEISEIFTSLKVKDGEAFGESRILYKDQDTVYYSRNDEKIKFYATNIAKMLHILDLAEEIDRLLIELEINKSKNVADDNSDNFGKIKVDISYGDANLFQTTRPNSIYSDKLRFIENGIEILDTSISGNWFDIIADVNVNFAGEIKLEGKIQPYLPSDRFKQFFVKRKTMTKDMGFKLLKEGKNVDEFNRSFIVNDIDFSIDESGKEKRSFTSWAMDQ